MSDARKLTDLSRQELYDLIWSTPVAKLASDFGVTESTVKNHCNNRRVPRPTLGYWKKLAAGIKPRKKALPPTAQEIFENEAQRRIPKSLALPEPASSLHALAADLLVALNKTKLGHSKLVHLEDPVFPEVTVSKPMVERAAQAFHIIIQRLEPLGIQFKKPQSSWGAGYFKRGNDRLLFHIYETLVDRSGAERRVEYYHWDTGGTPSGHLAFFYTPDRYSKKDEKERLETKGHKLAFVLSEVVSDIRQHFLIKQRERIQRAIEWKRMQEESERRHREWLVEEAIRKQKAAEKAHVDAIHAAVEARKQDLIKASEWWRRTCLINNYIEECERRWESAAGKLSSEQSSWLAWAKAIADSMSPFTGGYPDPAKHGEFDPAAIPFGGPYPAAKNLPPPT